MAPRQIEVAMYRPEMFLISREVMRSASKREIDASYADMEELGIAKLPYSTMDIGVPAHVFFKEDKDGRVDHNGMHISTMDVDDCLNKIATPEDRVKNLKSFGYKVLECAVRFCYVDGVHKQTMVGFDKVERCADFKFDSEWFDLHTGFRHYCTEMRIDAERFRRALIVLLGTRNIVKTRGKDKLQALGIGKHKHENNRPVYTTTLSLPVEYQEIHPSGPSGKPGVSKRPHLRRGHKRNQRCGPKGQFVKVIWIEPCFVNSDETYVSDRFSYNADIKGHNHEGKHLGADIELGNLRNVVHAQPKGQELRGDADTQENTGSGADKPAERPALGQDAGVARP